MEDPDVTEMKKKCNNREYVLQAVKGKGNFWNLQHLNFMMMKK